MAINGRVLRGATFDDDGGSAEAYLNDRENYPINLRFGRPKLTINDKIMVASMFHS